jgi:superoxide dismutase, Cu-Zn family
MSCFEAIAQFTTGPISGVVIFHQCMPNEAVLVTFDITGPPNRTMGCHIHMYGDLRKGCASLGPHWNPTHSVHGYTFDTSRPCHAGDLVGNVRTNAQGKYEFSYMDPKLTIQPGIYSVLGRSVVIHDSVDDLGLGGNEESLLTGNAGGRIACAVIGWAEGSM